MTVNQLEQLLNAIAAFNADATAAKTGMEAFAPRHAAIIASAKALGITRPNASKMLAKIKCEIAVPETGEAEPASQQAAE